MKKVLIVGNGVSRLDHYEYIQQWEGEIWGAGRIYKEVTQGKIQRLDILTGDSDIVQEALTLKRKHKLTFQFLAKRTKDLIDKEILPFDIPQKYIRDSGTSLVARAIIKQYDEIKCVGFDLGGKDIYIRGHQNRNKSVWIDNWRRIAWQLGLDNVEFIGTDHKPFILSNENKQTYAKYYLNGENHLKIDIKVNSEKLSNKLLIVGDSIQQENKTALEKIDTWKHELWYIDNSLQQDLQKAIDNDYEEIWLIAIDYEINNALIKKAIAKYGIEKIKFLGKQPGFVL